MEYSWTVTGQTQDTVFDGNGNATSGKQVSISIQPSGYTGQVFIPDAIYMNTDAVKEAIQHEVDSIMAVHALNG